MPSNDWPKLERLHEQSGDTAEAQFCPCIVSANNYERAGIGAKTGVRWALGIVCGLNVFFLAMYVITAIFRDTVTVIATIVLPAQLIVWLFIVLLLQKVRSSIGIVLGKRNDLCPALFFQCFGCHGITIAQESLAVGDPVAVIQPAAGDKEPEDLEQPAEKQQAELGASKASSHLAWNACFKSEDDSICASCLCCCRVSCLGFLMFYVAIAVLISLGYVVFMAITDVPCGIGSYNAELVLPANAAKAGIDLPIELGTKANFETELPFDLGGIWWIRWTGYDGAQITSPSLTSVGYDYYSALHLEELVSLKGARVNTTNASWFPLTFSAPTGRQHQWGFSSTIVGRVAMRFAADKDPEGPLNINFVNSTFGELDGFGGAFIARIDDDQWLRSSGTVDDPYQAPAYRLTRIIYEDGLPHPTYWPAFLTHMGSVQIRTFLHDNQCARQLGTIPTSSCSAIASQCGL